jgi:hypothetical protein
MNEFKSQRRRGRIEGSAKLEGLSGQEMLGYKFGENANLEESEPVSADDLAASQIAIAESSQQGGEKEVDAQFDIPESQDGGVETYRTVAETGAEIEFFEQGERASEAGKTEVLIPDVDEIVNMKDGEPKLEAALRYVKTLENQLDAFVDRIKEIDAKSDPESTNKLVDGWKNAASGIEVLNMVIDRLSNETFEETDLDQAVDNVVSLDSVRETSQVSDDGRGVEVVGGNTSADLDSVVAAKRLGKQPTSENAGAHGPNSETGVAGEPTEIEAQKSLADMLEDYLKQNVITRKGWDDMRDSGFNIGSNEHSKWMGERDKLMGIFESFPEDVQSALKGMQEDWGRNTMNPILEKTIAKLREIESGKTMDEIVEKAA